MVLLARSPRTTTPAVRPPVLRSVSLLPHTAPTVTPHVPIRPMTDQRAESPREVRSPFLLTTSVYHPDEPVSWPPHQHDEHELLWSDRGVVTMFAGSRQWTIAPGVGLWIPAGVVHEGSVRHNSAVRATYFAPSSWAKNWDTPMAVTLNSAARELLLHIKSATMTDEQRIRAQQVCIDMLEVSETAHLEVPIPRDPRLERLVDAVLYDPADDRSLEQWASMLNMTSRTLTRAFAAEIAMSFARWRRLVRMRAAAGDLADGTSVKVVARRVGYASTSAFVAAFHKTVGYPPGDLVTPR